MKDPPRLIDDPETLRHALAGRDIACPICGYNLRDASSPNCPECSARLDLRVGSVDLRLGAWITGVVALAVPFGFTGVVSGIVTYMMLIYAGMRPRGDDLLALVLGWAVSLALVIGMAAHIRSRGRFLRLPATKQRVIAGSLLLLAGGIVGFYIWLMTLI